LRRSGIQEKTRAKARFAFSGGKRRDQAGRIASACAGRWLAPVPLGVHGDGIDPVVFEALGARVAPAPLRDELERNGLMLDEEYRACAAVRPATTVEVGSKR